MVYTMDDWLETRKERGQTVKTDKSGGPEIAWLNPRRQGTIYLFVIDESIDDATAQLLVKYCEAFYAGVAVKLVRPGSKIKEKLPNGKFVTKKKLPENFVAAHSITTRQNMGYF